MIFPLIQDFADALAAMPREHPMIFSLIRDFAETLAAVGSDDECETEEAIQGPVQMDLTIERQHSGPPEGIRDWLNCRLIMSAARLPLMAGSQSRWKMDGPNGLRVI